MPSPTPYQRGMPTKKTRELAKQRGWEIDSAESFNPYSGRKKDLFGFIDLIALDGETIIAIQATSGSNASARVKKILEEQAHLAELWIRSGGRVLVIAWRKLKGQRALQYREIEIVLTPDGLGWEEPNVSVK